MTSKEPVFIIETNSGTGWLEEHRVMTMAKEARNSKL